jgi:hypothetical protein
MAERIPRASKPKENFSFDANGTVSRMKHAATVARFDTPGAL